ncbi:14954_t:CDS:2, partial [Racocetra fulgida]
MHLPEIKSIINSDIKSTDLNRWRLKVEDGRQTWHYLDEDEAKNWPQSVIEKYWIGLHFESKTFEKPKTAFEAAQNGFEYFKQLQTSDGHWAGEYGGPMFLIPGLIIAMYITHIPIPEVWGIEIIRYLVNKANPVDGRFWVHTRAVYLPMGYCYGRRLSAEVTPLIEQLRQELYVEPFETINWSSARNNIADVDLYVPHTKTL